MSVARPWSLSRRLVLGIVALLTLISIVIGAVSVLTLRQTLLQRLDTQLAAAMARSQTFLPQLGIGPSDEPPGIGSGQSAGTLGLIVRNGRIIAPRYLDEHAVSKTLTARQQRVLLSTDSSAPVTIQLGGELGSYRVVSATTTLGFELIVGLPMKDVNATTGQLLLIISLVTAVGILLAVVVATFVVRVARRPLSGVVATATRVSELELDKGEVALAERVPLADSSNSTEVGQVGAALNRMLEHVADALRARQASESKIRQFVADASHELRTPLASIRGYSELTRRSGHELPPDITKSLARIESESVRMTALVEELLLLARLDEGTELRVEAADVGQIAADAVEDARASSPDHSWVFARGPVSGLHAGVGATVTGDPARLHQAIANLLANARVHTPSGTTVTTTVDVDDRDVVVSIADDGPGIPEDLVPNLFERFVRGDGSRSRNAGSTGLGLSIVKAIADAHGGTVAVTSSPGQTRFTLRVPRSG
ncbi:MAG: HAMP domain-containing histidine kinase [Cryobacterium sp.]|nr:HAMP domain-containing histidine kinase [Cryobacterium sp.]